MFVSNMSICAATVAWPLACLRHLRGVAVTKLGSCTEQQQNVVFITCYRLQAEQTTAGPTHRQPNPLRTRQCLRLQLHARERRCPRDPSASPTAYSSAGASGTVCGHACAHFGSGVLTRLADAWVHQHQSKTVPVELYWMLY